MAANNCEPVNILLLLLELSDTPERIHTAVTARVVRIHSQSTSCFIFVKALVVSTARNEALCLFSVFSGLSFSTTIVQFLVFSRRFFSPSICCAKRFQNASQQTMDFKLPYDVIFAFAKHDESPSRRRPFRIFLDQNNILSTNSSDPWPTSAKHSVSSVHSVDSSRTFVSIRVHSWLIINDLVAT